MSFKTPLGKTIFETKPISAGCEFVSGYAFKSKDFSESGYPVIKIKNIQNKQVTLNGDNQFIPKSVITEKLNKFKLTHGDILIAMTGQGSVGRVGKLVLNDKQVTPYLNQRVGKFVPLHNVLDKDYLYYVISTSAYESLLFAAGSGSGQPNLSPSLIKGVEIPFPPIKVQESISKILRDLDEKIVTNVQMNQTLEEMSQAIFQSWFVDFDPVKAKMNGEQPEGMDAATASLFPEKLVESELGLIPDGWEVKPLDKVAHFQNGLALQKFRPESEDDDFLPVLKIAQLRQGYCDGKEKARTDIKESCRVYDGDMIFSWSGTLMIDLWTGDNAALNQHLFKVTSEEYNLPLYLHWTKHHLAKFQQIAKDKAVTMGHIKRGHLSESLCVIPPKALRDKMDEVLLPLINQGLNLRLQSNQLATLRDTLLPKLLSGEIELGETEEMAEVN